jgi:AI-2 transport protein TqsA
MNDTPKPVDAKQAKAATDQAADRGSITVRMQQLLLAAIAGGVVLVVLIQGRFFLIPLAIAILIFSLTSAAIDFFARQRVGSFHIPQWLATIVAMLAIAGTLLALFGVATSQIDTVMSVAPGYAERIEEAVAALFVWLGDDVAQGVLVAFQDINFGAYIRTMAGQAGNLLVAIVLVILYVGFLFAERPWFAAKISQLFPEPSRTASVDAIVTSISRSIHHYLLVKTAVSAVTGILVYLLLLLFGMDFAETLALLSFILNFIPNIGSIVATILPALVALVHYDGWAMVLVVLVSVGGVQFVIGNIVDPMLMGRALHLSSFAIILSLTFWGAVWGVIGMFLAVPIMVMVMIVCSHVPVLRPIAVLLSRDGSLPKEVGQRRTEGQAQQGIDRPGRNMPVSVGIVGSWWCAGLRGHIRRSMPARTEIPRPSACSGCRPRRGSGVRRAPPRPPPPCAGSPSGGYWWAADRRSSAGCRPGRLHISHAVEPDRSYQLSTMITQRNMRETSAPILKFG